MNTNLTLRKRNPKRKLRNLNSDLSSFRSAYLQPFYGIHHSLLISLPFSRRARVTIAEKEALAPDNEEVIKKKELEAEERRKESHNMVAESIRRELLESTSILILSFRTPCLLMHYFHIEEKEAEVPDVDDTDGIDPEGEFEAWRLRELARIKRDKEEAMKRELEREEVERRRAMPEEQRLKEDLERAEKLRAEKPKGQQKFLQKYWHKGAFHQVRCSKYSP